MLSFALKVHYQAFLALDTRTSKVIGQCRRHHRSVEIHEFLDGNETVVATELDVPLIMDNYGTHTTDLIRRWLVMRPRFPTYTSLPRVLPGSIWSSAASPCTRKATAPWWAPQQP